MAHQHQPCTLKVRCHGILEPELRRVSLTKGRETRFAELIDQLAELFQAELEQRVTYIDSDDDVITVTTDMELREAFESGAQVLEVRASTSSDPLCLEEWEYVSPINLAAAAPSQKPASVDWRSELRFWLNGQLQVLRNPSPSLLLADWLREFKGLTGTKIACGEGGCGACTVAISHVDEHGGIETLSVNACLRKMCSLDGLHVTTVEGIGSKTSGFHSIQKAIADCNGSQCGYCTPGWVMQMYALLQKQGKPARDEIEQHFDGNLCRCTGYRPILTAFGKFTGHETTCSHRGEGLPHPVEIFSHELEPLYFSDNANGLEWYRPCTLEQFRGCVAHSKTEGKPTKLICANTAAGVAKYYSTKDVAASDIVFLDISQLPDLQVAEYIPKKGLKCGAVVSIARVIDMLEKHASEEPNFTHIADHLKRVASVQIRNVGSWAGNLMFTQEHPAFASDVALTLATAGTSLSILLQDGTSKDNVTVPELMTMHGSGILVVSMLIPAASSASSVLRTYKVAARHVFAHAIVNLGAYFSFGDDGITLTGANLVVGGACRTILQSNAMKSIIGDKISNASFKTAADMLLQEISQHPSPDARQTSSYREHLAICFLYKAFLAARASKTRLPSQLQSTQQSFIPANARPVSTGTESYGINPAEGPISEYVPKLEARVQASGEAVYASDAGKGALFVQIVFSTTAGATLTALDAHDALSMPGVVDFVTASSVPGKNCVDGKSGGANNLEKVFFEVGDHIPCIGVQLGAIVADTWAHARMAAKKVVQKYSSHRTPVTSMEKAKKVGRNPDKDDLMHGFANLLDPSYLARKRFFRKPVFGKVEHQGLQEASCGMDGKSSVKAEFNWGGQYHFYMEAQATVVTPTDGDRWEVLTSTQDPDFTNAAVAQVLATPRSHVNVKCARAGGAFGGKLTRQNPLACACAAAAYKLKVPIKGINERSDDMQMSSGRELFDFEYDVSFDSEGKVDSMDMVVNFGPGWFFGDVAADLDQGITWSDDCYHYNRFKVDRKILTTDIPHTTSMRAPGCLNSCVLQQVVMEHVAKSVGKQTEEIQALNFYKPGDFTPFGDQIGREGYNFTIPILWEKLQKDADYIARKDKVAAYNKENKWTKKGISICPTKYVMNMLGYTSGALVCIHGDGSVLVTTGGCEVGQGLYTKVALCAANTLGIPLSKVSVAPTETQKLPNNGCTGGSGTSESSSEAAIMACTELAGRLKPYRKEGVSWEDSIAKANTDHVSLVASSWYSWEKRENTFQYATYGVAISEVLVDVLTGETRVEQVDILMDLGTQLDAAVDIGQLQGGFVMALGYLLTEESKYDDDGNRMFLGTWEYKIPSAYDIPLVFNVSLLKDSPNPVGVKGSKASAEPVMALISSTLLAVKEAIYSARKDNGKGTDWFQLDLPITPERIQAAVGTKAEELVVP